MREARTLHFVLPGPAETLTGGYHYDRRIIDGLRALGWQVRVEELPAQFPHPGRDALDAAVSCLESCDDHALVMVDGLALGVLPDLARKHARRLRLVGLVHHPLHAGSGLGADAQRRLFESERVALSFVRQVIVTGEDTAAQMLASGLVARRPAVVEPGVQRHAPRAPSGEAHTRLLCIATLTPRKNHVGLIDALAQLRDLPWSLRCFGSLHMHAPTVRAVRQRIARHGLGERVDLEGEVPADALARIRGESDLLVLPSLYEGYGMVVAEALVQGLPVVATRTGAAAALVGDDAGLVVPPGNVAALRDALRLMLMDVSRREACAAAALRRGALLTDWSGAAARLSALLETVA